MLNHLWTLCQVRHVPCEQVFLSGSETNMKRCNCMSPVLMEALQVVSDERIWSMRCWEKERRLTIFDIFQQHCRGGVWWHWNAPATYNLWSLSLLNLCGFSLFLLYTTFTSSGCLASCNASGVILLTLSSLSLSKPCWHCEIIRCSQCWPSLTHQCALLYVVPISTSLLLPHDDHWDCGHLWMHIDSKVLRIDEIFDMLWGQKGPHALCCHWPKEWVRYSM